MFRVAIVLIVSLACLIGGAAGAEAQWRAGVARVEITPELPIWLSGYGARDRPGNEVLDDLWAKALVLEDGSGNRAVLVTMDLVGIDRGLSGDVCRRLEQRYGLPRAAVALATSHTHSGPVVGSNLDALYELDADQSARVEAYTAQLADRLVRLVGEAIGSLESAQLFRGNGTATFAVNRRNNPEAQVPQRRQEDALLGPVDHDVPVLLVRDAAADRPLAIVCGYACHATVLSGFQVSGDWPGAAQREIERRHPGATALFWAGCGGDQNPIPRRSVELVNRYGSELADGVDMALAGPMTAIPSSLAVAYKEFDLAFADLPSRAELELTAAGDARQARWAKYLLSVWDNEGGLRETYPYPVQAWHLGPDLSWVFLGGEVVVDYALRLKSESESAAGDLWIASYANDVMGYIPSRRVLAEGGYEGGGARFPYGLPAVWSPDVERQVLEAVGELTGDRGGPSIE